MGAAPASDKETSEGAEKGKDAHSEGALIADRYELVSQVGIGGMGVVWRARDRKLGRAVAVKVLSGASVGNEIARTRLIREARAAAALEHEGIIRVYDVGETDDGGAFLVMELIRGRSLRYVIEDKSMKLGSIAQVIVQAGRALQFAHDAGIVHRDMKPDNIMIREDGRVTVVDFGVAKPIATDLMVIAGTVAGTPAGGALTGSGQLVGTPAYLAPEQARGLPVGPATDQFALAVTAYEALTGARPWTGSCFSEVIASLLRDAPVPVSSVIEDVPKAVDDVLMTALSKDPTVRYADIGAFADALEDAARTLPLDPVRAQSRRSNAITHPDPPQVSVPAALTPPSAPLAPPVSAEPSPADGVPITTTGKMSVEMTRASSGSDPGASPERPSKADHVGVAATRASRNGALYIVGAVAALGIGLGLWVAGPAASATSSPGTPTVTQVTTQAPSPPTPASTARVTAASPSAESTVSSSEPPPPTTASAPSNTVSAVVSSVPKRPGLVTTTSASPRVPASSSAKPIASSPQPAVKPSATSTGRRVREDL